MDPVFKGFRILTSGYAQNIVQNKLYFGCLAECTYTATLAL